jgi:hypothetical protein
MLSREPGPPEMFTSGNEIVVRQGSVQPQTRYMPTNKPVDIDDEWCSQTFYVAAAAGSVYWVDFTYVDRQLCSESCARVAPGGALGPSARWDCPEPDAEQIRRLAAED